MFQGLFPRRLFRAPGSASASCLDLKAPAPKGGKVGEKCSGHVVYGEPYWITWSVSPHLFDVTAFLMRDIRPLLLKATPEEKIRSQYLPSSEIAMDQAEIDNWAKIAESMEGNGDTES